MLHRFTVRLNSVFASGLTLASLSGLDRFLHTALNGKYELGSNIDASFESFILLKNNIIDGMIKNSIMSI